jgi:hypothetical protein
VGLLNACARIVALEEGRCVLMSRSLKVDGIQMSLWGISLLTSMQSVGALTWRVFNNMPSFDVDYSWRMHMHQAW